jgi:hypothetical protein
MIVEDVVVLGQEAQEVVSTNPDHAPGLIREHLTNPHLLYRRRAHEYVDACLSIEGIRVIRNDIEFETSASVEPTVGEALLEQGYTRFDMFGLPHMFVATKPAASNIELASNDHHTRHQEASVRHSERVTPDILSRHDEVDNAEAVAPRRDRNAAHHLSIS